MIFRHTHLLQTLPETRLCPKHAVHRKCVVCAAVEMWEVIFSFAENSRRHHNLVLIQGILHCKTLHLLLNAPHLKFFIPPKHDFEQFYLYFWGSKYFHEPDISEEIFFRETKMFFGIYRYLRS